MWSQVSCSPNLAPQKLALVFRPRFSAQVNSNSGQKQVGYRPVGSNSLANLNGGTSRLWMGSGIVRISLQIFSNFFEMLTLQQSKIAPLPSGVGVEVGMGVVMWRIVSHRVFRIKVFKKSCNLRPDQRLYG